MIKIFCDSCENEMQLNDYVKIEHTFSYGSQRDGDTVNLDLCEFCFEKIYENIKNVKSLI